MQKIWAWLTSNLASPSAAASADIGQVCRPPARDTPVAPYFLSSPGEQSNHSEIRHRQESNTNSMDLVANRDRAMTLPRTTFQRSIQLLLTLLLVLILGPANAASVPSEVFGSPRVSAPSGNAESLQSEQLVDSRYQIRLPSMTGAPCRTMGKLPFRYRVRSRNRGSNCHSDAQLA